MHRQTGVFKINLDKNSDLRCINMDSYKAALFFIDKWLVHKQFTKDTRTSSKEPVMTICIINSYSLRDSFTERTWKLSKEKKNLIKLLAFVLHRLIC